MNNKVAKLTFSIILSLFLIGTVSAQEVTWDNRNPFDGQSIGFQTEQFTYTATAETVEIDIVGYELDYPNGTELFVAEEYTDPTPLSPGESYSYVSSGFNFNASNMPEGDYTWRAVAHNLSTGNTYRSNDYTLTLDSDDATISFKNLQPADNSQYNKGDTVDFSADIVTAEGLDMQSAEIQWSSSKGSIGSIGSIGSFTAPETITGSETFNEVADYSWWAQTTSEGGAIHESSTYTFEIPASATWTNFNPPDGTTITEGETQTISVDVSVDNGGSSVDIEGIYDGQVDTEFGHPGDGSTQTYSFDVTPSTGGNYYYWFNAKDSSSGDPISSTETRTLNVNDASVTWTNFNPPDGEVITQGETQTISVDATIDNGGNFVDIAGRFDGSQEEVFSHPGDGSTQTYSFDVTPSEGSYTYEFEAIDSSSSEFIGDTTTRTLNVDSPISFSGLTPPDYDVRGFSTVSFNETISVASVSDIDLESTSIHILYPNGTELDWKYSDFGGTSLGPGESYTFNYDFNFNASNMPEGDYTWEAWGTDQDTTDGTFYKSGMKTLTVQGDAGSDLIEFSNYNPSNNTVINVSEDVNFQTLIEAPEGNNFTYAQIQWYSLEDNGAGQILPSSPYYDNVFIDQTKNFDEKGRYAWEPLALLEGADYINSGETRYFNITNTAKPVDIEILTEDTIDVDYSPAWMGTPLEWKVQSFGESGTVEVRRNGTILYNKSFSDWADKTFTELHDDLYANNLTTDNFTTNDVNNFNYFEDCTDSFSSAYSTSCVHYKTTSSTSSNPYAWIKYDYSLDIPVESTRWLNTTQHQQFIVESGNDVEPFGMFLFNGSTSQQSITRTVYSTNGDKTWDWRGTANYRFNRVNNTHINVTIYLDGQDVSADEGYGKYVDQKYNKLFRADNSFEIAFGTNDNHNDWDYTNTHAIYNITTDLNVEGINQQPKSTFYRYGKYYEYTFEVEAGDYTGSKTKMIHITQKNPIVNITSPSHNSSVNPYFEPHNPTVDTYYEPLTYEVEVNWSKAINADFSRGATHSLTLGLADKEKNKFSDIKKFYVDPSDEVYDNGVKTYRITVTSSNYYSIIDVLKGDELILRPFIRDEDNDTYLGFQEEPLKINYPNRDFESPITPQFIPDEKDSYLESPVHETSKTYGETNTVQINYTVDWDSINSRFDSSRNVTVQVSDANMSSDMKSDDIQAYQNIEEGGKIGDYSGVQTYTYEAPVESYSDSYDNRYYTAGYVYNYDSEEGFTIYSKEEGVIHKMDIKSSSFDITAFNNGDPVSYELKWELGKDVTSHDPIPQGQIKEFNDNTLNIEGLTESIDWDAKFYDADDYQYSKQTTIDYSSSGWNIDNSRISDTDKQYITTERKITNLMDEPITGNIEVPLRGSVVEGQRTYVDSIPAGETASINPVFEVDYLESTGGGFVQDADQISETGEKVYIKRDELTVENTGDIRLENISLGHKSGWDCVGDGEFDINARQTKTIAGDVACEGNNEITETFNGKSRTASEVVVGEPINYQANITVENPTDIDFKDIIVNLTSSTENIGNYPLTYDSHGKVSSATELNNNIDTFVDTNAIDVNNGIVVLESSNKDGYFKTTEPEFRKLDIETDIPVPEDSNVTLTVDGIEYELTQGVNTLTFEEGKTSFRVDLEEGDSVGDYSGPSIMSYETYEASKLGASNPGIDINTPGEDERVEYYNLDDKKDLEVSINWSHWHDNVGGSEWNYSVVIIPYNETDESTIYSSIYIVSEYPENHVTGIDSNTGVKTYNHEDLWTPGETMSSYRGEDISYKLGVEVINETQSIPPPTTQSEFQALRFKHIENYTDGVPIDDFVFKDDFNAQSSKIYTKEYGFNNVTAGTAKCDANWSNFGDYCRKIESLSEGSRYHYEFFVDVKSDNHKDLPIIKEVPRDVLVDWAFASDIDFAVNGSKEDLSIDSNREDGIGFKVGTDYGNSSLEKGTWVYEISYDRSSSGDDDGDTGGGSGGGDDDEIGSTKSFSLSTNEISHNLQSRESTTDQFTVSNLLSREISVDIVRGPEQACDYVGLRSGGDTFSSLYDQNIESGTGGFGGDTFITYNIQMPEDSNDVYTCDYTITEKDGYSENLTFIFGETIKEEESVLEEFQNLMTGAATAGTPSEKICLRDADGECTQEFNIPGIQMWMLGLITLIAIVGFFSYGTIKKWYRRAVKGEPF